MRLIDADKLCMEIAHWQFASNNNIEKDTLEDVITLISEEPTAFTEKEYAKEVVLMQSINEDVKVGNLKFKAGCKLHKCPTCDRFLSNDIYCRYCGQKLKRRSDE